MIHFNRTSRLTISLNIFIIVVLILMVGACSPDQKSSSNFNYPKAHRGDVVDDYYGTEVADPYRWLEDPDSKETIKFVEAQNKLTAEYLDLPIREKIKTKLALLWNYSQRKCVRKVGNRYFYWQSDSLKNHAILYVQNNPSYPPQIVLDPNQLSEDGTIAVKQLHFTNDGRYLAYEISHQGSDRVEIHVRDIMAKQELSDTIKHCKWPGVCWLKDNSGFFYNRYPDPEKVAAEDEHNYNRVYFHRLGTAQNDDVLIYKRDDYKELSYSPQQSSDGDYMLLSVWRGTEPVNRFYYKNLQNDSPIVRLLDDADARYDWLANDGSLFYFLTNKNAPNNRIIAIDIKNPAQENWKEIIPEQKDALSEAVMINNQLVLHYIHDAHSVLKIYNTDGSFEKDIPMPTLGTVSKYTGEKNHTEMFLKFTSFLYPPSVFHYDFKSGNLTPVHLPKIEFDPSLYETKLEFCISKDGTKIPLFVTSKKGTKLDGTNPVMLYGYGGFGVNMTPFFSITHTFWLDNGGVFALAVLRGGSEYGLKWRQAGMLENRQNVYDDFIACSQWLIDNKYTNTSRLAIRGGSNGGLLVAECMIQRPDLFGAILCGVPVIDMLRYHKFTVGKFWTADYGNADESVEQFNVIYPISPLHNIVQGETYPPILITTADTDDRVVPAHGKKFAAALQANGSGLNPILLRVDIKAGHGSGKPTSKRLDETADKFTFLFKLFEMDIEE